MTKLKPCPFCGSRALYEVYQELDGFTVPVMFCDWCKALVTFEGYEDYVTEENDGMVELRAAWSRRASDHTTTRHGRYRTKYGRRVPLCECCGYSIGDLRWKFCPGCGAEVVDHD